MLLMHIDLDAQSIIKHVSGNVYQVIDNVKKFNIKKIYKVLTIFYLGGVSNLPSRRSLKMKKNTGIISIIKELLKFSLLKIVGKDSFYKIIYYFKYDRVDYKKISKIYK